MQKYRKISILTIVLVGLWRVSQIIFDVMYSSNKENYLGISHGSRVQFLAPSGGYFEKNFGLITDSKPTAYIPTSMDKFQDTCTYGQGNCIGFFDQDILSSFRWINAIQYIAQKVEPSQPSDVTNRFASLFAIKPKRYYPYILIQYLGTPSLDIQDKQDAKIAWENTIQLGEKGIHYFCDSNKIQAINNLDYASFIQALDDKKSEYRYPCREGGSLAHTLAFNYYYYLKDSDRSALYYKVASFHDDVPAITKSMPAIIEGKEGNNKISAYLRYDQFYSTTIKLEQKGKLESDEVTSLEGTLEKNIQKMVSEYSLYILNKASESAKNTGSNTCATDKQCLVSQGYITQIITQTNSICNTNPIDCQIIAIGKERGYISSNGTLIYPEDNRIDYIRNSENNIWETKYIQE